MPYFFILPAFLAWLVVAAIGLVIIRKNSQLSHVYPYAWRVALWSTVGFVLANVLLVVIVAGALLILGPDSPERTVARDGLQLFVGLGAMVGPIAASLLGWLIGAVLGGLLAHRAQQKTWRPS